MKNCFKILLVLSSVDIMFPVTPKMVSPNKPNSMNFRTEIGLNMIFKQNALFVITLFSIYGIKQNNSVIQTHQLVLFYYVHT